MRCTILISIATSVALFFTSCSFVTCISAATSPTSTTMSSEKKYLRPFMSASNNVTYPSVWSFILHDEIDEREEIDSVFANLAAELDILDIYCSQGTLGRRRNMCRYLILIHSGEEQAFVERLLSANPTIDEWHFDHHSTDALYNRNPVDIGNADIEEVKEVKGQASSIEAHTTDKKGRNLDGRTDNDQLNIPEYSHIPDFPCYYDYTSTIRWIENLVEMQEEEEQQQQLENNTDSERQATQKLNDNVHLEWINIGPSYLKTQNVLEGHDLMALKVSSSMNIFNSKPKAPMVIMTGIHPREYSPPEVVRRWIEWLVMSVDINRTSDSLSQDGKQSNVQSMILATTDIYWIPYVNPDGRIVAERTQIFRRKNMRPPPTNSRNNDCGGLDSSSYGVDLNRNFPFAYGRNDGSSSNPCRQTYRGSGPASEPEVQAVVNFLMKIFPNQQRLSVSSSPQVDDLLNFGGYPATKTTGVFLDLHSFGNYYIYPWGFANRQTANHEALTTLTRKLGDITGYDNQGPGWNFASEASGATDDWAYATLGAAGMTWELGTNFHQDCVTFEQNIVGINMDALTYTATLASRPYLLAQGADIKRFEAIAVIESVFDTGYNETPPYIGIDDVDTISVTVDILDESALILLFIARDTHEDHPYNRQGWDWKSPNSMISLADFAFVGSVNAGTLYNVSTIISNGLNESESMYKYDDISDGQVECHFLIYAMALTTDGTPGPMVVESIAFQNFDLSEEDSVHAAIFPSDVPSMAPSLKPTDVSFDETAFPTMPIEARIRPSINNRSIDSILEQNSSAAALPQGIILMPMVSFIFAILLSVFL